jgi:hypothetical protein
VIPRSPAPGSRLPTDEPGEPDGEPDGEPEPRLSMRMLWPVAPRPHSAKLARPVPAPRLRLRLRLRLRSKLVVAMAFAALVPVVVLAALATGVILSSLDASLEADADRQLTVGINLVLRSVERLADEGCDILAAIGEFRGGRPLVLCPLVLCAVFSA